MNAPPIQYARTSDGYSIAYNVCGEGRTLLTMPYPFSHARLSWTAPGLMETSRHLAESFRVVHFDARGQGLSTRGLNETLRMEDYLLDIEAVADALALDRFLLFASISFWRPAIAYAARNPQRVEALLLLNPDGPSEPATHAFELSNQVQNNWDAYLLMVGSTVSAAPTDTAGRFSLRDLMKECIAPQDYLNMVEAMRRGDLRDYLPALTVPSLVISQRGPWNDGDAPEVASAIPGAKLAVVSDFGNMFYSASGETPPGIKAIEEFVAALPASAEPAGLPQASAGVVTSMARLSDRQRQVLHLIAEGRTNREIAEALVLSERTVERHVADVYAKIGAANRAQAAVYAKEHGLV